MTHNEYSYMYVHSTLELYYKLKIVLKFLLLPDELLQIQAKKLTVTKLCVFSAMVTSVHEVWCLETGL